jgi:hypothetical protein
VEIEDLPQENEFKEMFQNEIEKVENFFNERTAAAEKRFNSLLQQLDRLVSIFSLYSFFKKKKISFFELMNNDQSNFRQRFLNLKKFLVEVSSRLNFVLASKREVSCFIEIPGTKV